METFKIEGVEIFSVGKWNGEDFTADDLNEMVKSFEATKEGIKPGLKLGHDKKQALLQASGLPSAGWAERLYVRGNKLCADLGDIPKAIYQLIQKGAYKKPSIELFPKITIKGKEYKNLIGAIALLGAETPGVMDLADIMKLYGTEEKPVTYESDIELNFTTITRKDHMKTEEQIREEVIAELKATADAEKAAALEAQVAEFAAKDLAKDEELKTLRQAKADADKKSLEDAVKVQEAETKAFVTGLVSEKLCTAAMEPIITEILSNKKEFSVKSGEKELKTKEELLKEALLLFKSAAAVNFTESSVTGDKDNKLEAEQKELEEKVKKFAAEKGITYGQALKQFNKKD